MSGAHDHLASARVVLAPRQYIVWRLRVQGMTWGEIALATDLDRTTVRRYHQRAVQLLAMSMGSEEAVGDE